MYFSYEVNVSFLAYIFWETILFDLTYMSERIIPFVCSDILFILVLIGRVD